MNSTVKRFIHARTSEEMDGAIHEIAFLKICSKAPTPGMDGGGWYVWPISLYPSELQNFTSLIIIYF